MVTQLASTVRWFKFAFFTCDLSQLSHSSVARDAANGVQTHSSVRVRLARETKISPDHTRFGQSETGEMPCLHLLTVIPNYVFFCCFLYTPDLVEGRVATLFKFYTK